MTRASRMTRAKPKPQSPSRPLTPAERQARWRAKRNALAALGATIATGQVTSPLRNETRLPTRPPLRNAETADDLDARLTTLKQHGDALMTAYCALLKTPGLTPAEAATISGRYRGWRQAFDKTAKDARPRFTVVTPTVKGAR